jgi:hypothetical protein
MRYRTPNIDRVAPEDLQGIPSRQAPASFSIDEALEKARAAEKQIASVTAAGGTR